MESRQNIGHSENLIGDPAKSVGSLHGVPDDIPDVPIGLPDGNIHLPDLPNEASDGPNASSDSPDASPDPPDEPSDAAIFLPDPLHRPPDLAQLNSITADGNERGSNPVTVTRPAGP